jgi:hypothetical protein
MLIGCICLGVLFLIVCVSLILDFNYDSREEKCIQYIESKGYIKAGAIKWQDSTMYDVIYQYRKHYNIPAEQKLYVKVCYGNYQLNMIDIMMERRFDKVSFISGADIKLFCENKIPVKNITSYETVIKFDKYGNITYDI